jgi:hypothetical protein
MNESTTQREMCDEPKKGLFESDVPETPISYFPPKVKEWKDHGTTFLPGDLVETKFGKAIISTAEIVQGEFESYSVWLFPGAPWAKLSFSWIPPHTHWYGLHELRLIEKGHASVARDKARLSDP